MSLAQSIFDLPSEYKSLIRKVERLQNKEINLHYNVVFNEICLNEGLLPIYTNIRLHDPRARQEGFTVKYKKELIKRQVNLKKEEVLTNQTKLDEAWTGLNQLPLEEERRRIIINALKDNASHTQRLAKNRTTKKLSNLYGGRMTLPEHKDGYINLSDHILTDTQKDILNLGLNCHLQSKYNKMDKKVELEALYDSLIKLQDKCKVTIDNDLKDQLKAEGTKRRDYRNSDLLTFEQRQAAKELKETAGLTIRRADKSSIYVLLNTDDYMTKLNDMLNDRTKFTLITRDPTEILKTKVKKLITANNAKVGHTYIPPLSDRIVLDTYTVTSRYIKPITHLDLSYPKSQPQLIRLPNALMKLLLHTSLANIHSNQ